MATCLIVNLITNYTDGVYNLHSKGPCIVVVIVGALQIELIIHGPLSTFFFFSCLKMLVDGMRAFILLIAVYCNRSHFSYRLDQFQFQFPTTVRLRNTEKKETETAAQFQFQFPLRLGLAS
jgi:hypothetical protein